MDKNVTVSFSLRSLLVIGLVLLALAIAYTVRDVIILFVLAYILASAMRPFVDMMKNRAKMPKVLSILFLYAALLIAIFFIFKVLAPPIVDQANDLVNNRQVLDDQFQKYFSQLPDGAEKPVAEYILQLPAKIKTFFFSGTTLDGVLGLFAGFGGLVTVMFVSFYMLLENSSFEKFIVNLWPGQTREKVRMQKAFQQVDLKVSMWVRGQAILSLAVGILTLVGLTMLGVPYALVLSIIAALTELIPYVGPIVGSVPAIIIAFLVSPPLALWVILLTIGVQQFEQHVLVPQVMKRAVGLSAVAVIFSILVGAKLFGILGAIVAIPTAAGIKVMSDSLKKRG